MKRPLLAVGLTWFFATWLAFFLGQAVLSVSIASLLTAALFFLLHQRNHASYSKLRGMTRSVTQALQGAGNEDPRVGFKYAYAACVVALTASLAFAGFWIHEKRNVEPVLALAGKTVTVEGLITEADSGIRAMTYTVKARFTDYPDVPETTLLVRDFSGIEQSAGNTVRFLVDVSEAPSSTWYRSRGILLTGQAPADVESIPVGKHRMERALMRLRVLLSRNAYANLDEENANVVTGMVLGLKNNIPSEVYSAMGKSGTSHLLAVSGMHLSILSAIVLFALKRLGCPRRLAALAAIAFGFLFSLLVGFSAPVFRSFVMTAVTLLAGRVFSRRSDSLSSLGLALLVCGIVWPHWTLGWGIWFSAGSTLGIILYSSKLSDMLRSSLVQKTRMQKRVVSAVSGAIGIDLAAYAFTLPFSFLMTGWFSLVSPLANLLIAPFVPVTILCGAICAFLPSTAPAVEIIAKLTDISTAFIILISERLGALPFATFAMDESWILILLFGIVAVIAALLMFRPDKQLVSYAAALIVVCCCVGNLSLAAANHGKIELVTLEDKNAAVLLRDGEAVILGTPDAYEITTLLRYLTFRGVKNIPAVIASDSPDNVSSGLLRLAGAYDIDCVIAPNDAYVEDALARALPASMIYSGGYAKITALGGVVISPDLNGRDIHIRIGKNEIVKIRREYAIIIESDNRIQIFNDGKMLLPRNVHPLFEPAGAFLFGESRLLLRE